MLRLAVFALIAAIVSAQTFSVDCGGGATCQDGQTCCATSSGGWGCCPAPKATCCSDHVHCCPSQYPVCDTTSGQCKASSDVGAEWVPLLRKLPAFASETSSSAPVRMLDLTGTATVTDCGDSSFSAHLANPAVTPASPTKGKPVNVGATVDASKAVSGGSYKIAVKLNGAQVFTHTGNVCGNDKISLPLGVGTILYTGATCPVAASGTFPMSLGVTIPNIAPAGAYTFEMSTTDSSGANFFCLSSTFHL